MSDIVALTLESVMNPVEEITTVEIDTDEVINTESCDFLEITEEAEIVLRNCTTCEAAMEVATENNSPQKKNIFKRAWEMLIRALKAIGKAFAWIGRKIKEFFTKRKQEKKPEINEKQIEETIKKDESAANAAKEIVKCDTIANIAPEFTQTANTYVETISQSFNELEKIKSKADDSITERHSELRKVIEDNKKTAVSDKKEFQERLESIDKESDNAIIHSSEVIQKYISDTQSADAVKKIEEALKECETVRSKAEVLILKLSKNDDGSIPEDDTKCMIETLNTIVSNMQLQARILGRLAPAVATIDQRLDNLLGGNGQPATTADILTITGPYADAIDGLSLYDLSIIVDEGDTEEMQSEIARLQKREKRMPTVSQLCSKVNQAANPFIKNSAINLYGDDIETQFTSVERGLLRISELAFATRRLYDIIYKNDICRKNLQKLASLLEGYCNEAYPCFINRIPKELIDMYVKKYSEQEKYSFAVDLEKDRLWK